MFSLVAFIPRAILQGMPLLFGCTGETISEKVGSLNLGIPGVMYVGAICGVIGSFLYEQSCGGQVVPIVAILIPFLACLAGALIMGLLFLIFTPSAAGKSAGALWLLSPFVLFALGLPRPSAAPPPVPAPVS